MCKQIVNIIIIITPHEFLTTALVDDISGVSE